MKIDPAEIMTRPALRWHGGKDAWRGEKANGRRSKARQTKLAIWADPPWRERTVEAMRNGKRGQFKRAVLKLVRDSPTIEAHEIAAKLRLSTEQVKIIWRRAFRMNEIDRKPFNERKPTQCVRGHPFNAENTYVSKCGFRSCKQCSRLRQKRTRSIQRLEAAQ
jgi:hypothetical protein